MKSLFFYFFLLLPLLVKGDNLNTYFKSDWNNTKNQIWLGADYWSNPLQDWRVLNGRVECLVSKPKRSFKLLTYEIENNIQGEFSMAVDIGTISTNTVIDNSSAFAGFLIGVKSKFNNYKSAAINTNKKSIKVGITIDKKIFIGDIKNAVQLKSFNFQKGVRLELKIVQQEEGNYYLTLNAFDIVLNKLIGTIEKNNILESALTGMLGLTSDFPNRGFSKTKMERVKSFWFDNFNLSGTKIKHNPKHALGPLLFAMYTLNQKILKLTVQLAPLNLSENNLIDFQIKDKKGKWNTINQVPVDTLARTAIFRITNWDSSKDTPYRLFFQPYKKSLPSYLKGTIRKEPDKEIIKIAALSCNDDYGFPHTDILKHVPQHNPDLYFFAGDQLYQSDYYGVADWKMPLKLTILDYLRKWYLFGWGYKEILCNNPVIVIPDDHDVYQGNIWGNGGVDTPIRTNGKKNATDGGYIMSKEFVNVVQQTQSGHLPAPYSKSLVGKGIKTYYCDLTYGGVSFAILEDRKFKSPPIGNSKKITQDELEKAHELDLPELKLLGKTQLKFLKKWSQDWSNNTWMKVILSQTIFTQLSTTPTFKRNVFEKGIYPKHNWYRSFDTNGWPQTGRNKAIDLFRRCFAFHISGDQHLGSTVQYGVDTWRDANYALCVPAVSSVARRQWFPPKRGFNSSLNSPKNIGNFKDGFNNFISVEAIANPYITNLKPAKLYDRATGYGIVKLNKRTRDIGIEVWARQTDPSELDAKPVEGWPITINQLDNFGKKAIAFLPKLSITGITNPTIQVIQESTNEVVYTLRIKGNTFQPKVFAHGTYTILLGELNTPNVKILKNIQSIQANFKQELNVKF